MQEKPNVAKNPTGEMGPRFVSKTTTSFWAGGDCSPSAFHNMTRIFHRREGEERSDITCHL
jgi:hypothetical protein